MLSEPTTRPEVDKAGRAGMRLRHKRRQRRSKLVRAPLVGRQRTVALTITMVTARRPKWAQSRSPE
eukprot:14780115-Alexandrium_andersonii.AAC.1